jgi:predicted ATPase/DNA-binding CsgD family transcriptional regulator
MADPTPADRGRIHPVDPVPFPERERGPVQLPAPLTSFVGREREVAAVVELLRRPGVRLVTLTGPGGVGKTRLALAVAAEAVAAFADGAVFVPLAPIRDPALVLPTVAHALGFRDGGDRPLAARLATALRDRTVLLVLDNLEQVLDAGPQLAELLAGCPGLTVLATSRALLRVSGEHDFPVAPLARTEAVALFVARAEAAIPGFSLAAGDAASVAALCDRLDGLPLAIELAAARVRVLSPRALEARLTERLRLLTGGARDQPPRLRSMRDALAWSHDLLAAEEQALFRRLAVFAGGFTLEAAGAVCGEPGLDVLDGVTALMDQSLLQRTEHGDQGPRFGMLETVREYAAERLEASGEAEALRTGHAAYFAALAERGGVMWWTPKALIGEEPNVRAALEWATERGATDLLPRLAIALWQFTEPVGGYGWLERAVAATARVPAALRGRRALLLAVTAQFAMWRSDLVRANALLDEGVALAREADESEAVAHAMIVLGYVAGGVGDSDRAATLAAEAHARCQALGKPGWTGEALCLLGSIAMRRGEFARAEELLAETLGLQRAAGWHPAVAMTLAFLAGCVHELGDQRRAAALIAEGLTLNRDGAHPINDALCLATLGAVAAAVGRAEPAARLFGAEEALRERRGLDLTPAGRPRRDRLVAPARARLPASAFAAAWEAGRALSPDRAVAEALALANAIASTAADRRHAADGLTPREQEVLHLLAEGRSDREIAAALFISPKTASVHIGNILGKLGVPSRAAAVAFAHRHGLAGNGTPGPVA